MISFVGEEWGDTSSSTRGIVVSEFRQRCKGTSNMPLQSPFQSSGVTWKLIQHYIVILGLTPIIPRALRCHPAPFPCSDPGYQCRDAKTL